MFGGQSINIRVLFISPYFEFGENNINSWGFGGAISIYRNLFLGGYKQWGSWIDLSRTSNFEIDYGHGGLWLGYLSPIGKSRFSIIPSIYLARGKSIAKQTAPIPFFDAQQKFNLLTPEIGLDYRILTFVKLSMSTGYHIYSNIDQDDLPVGYRNFDLNNYYLKCTLRLGL